MKEIKVLSKICALIYKQSSFYIERKRIEHLKNYSIDGTKITKNVEIFNVQNVIIGENTYFNSGQIHAGIIAKIIIGKNCAIGYNVHIKARTHNIKSPTGENMIMIEKDIEIGDNVWIGDNVFIKEGVKIGSNVIIGANSVVTKNIPDNVMAGGCPAKIIKRLM